MGTGKCSARAFSKPCDNGPIVLGATQELPIQRMELGSNPSSFTFWLCSLGKVTYPLWPQFPYLYKGHNYAP